MRHAQGRTGECHTGDGTEQTRSENYSEPLPGGQCSPCATLPHARSGVRRAAGAAAGIDETITDCGVAELLDGLRHLKGTGSLLGVFIPKPQAGSGDRSRSRRSAIA